MKSKEISKEDLEQLQQKAVVKAIRENKALKLAYKTVEKGDLFEVAADGTKTKLGKSKFATVRVHQKSIKLKN